MPPDDREKNGFHDFLAVEHEHVGFLINRDQFFASVYLRDIDPPGDAETLPAYVGGTMVFRDETLLVYKLDDELGDLFLDKPQEGLKIALIAEAEAFSAAGRLEFRALVEKAVPEASRDRVAFRIGSEAEITSIPLHQVRLVPGSLKQALGRKGILGCRFADTEGISFFIDIETIAFGGMKTR